jgi:hypothetical protein
MTRRGKIATIAAVALLSGIATMFLLHTFGPLPSFVGAGIRREMGWMMLFGPFGMIISFGGFVTLVVLLITSLVQSSAERT